MKIVSVVSGKGGVGKSVIAANLASIIAEEGYRVLLVDADLSLGNLDTILNVRSEKNIFSFFSNEVKFSEILLQIKPNLYLLPSYSGEEILSLYSDELKQCLKTELETLSNIDFIIIDTQSGIGKLTQDFIEISDEVLVISVPEPTAIIDAYAMIKIVSKFKSSAFFALNLAKNEGENLALNFTKVLKNNTQKEFSLNYLGEVKQDYRVAQSVRDREIFADEYPNSLVLNQLKTIASNLLVAFGRKPMKIESISGMGGVFKRILDLV